MSSVSYAQDISTNNNSIYIDGMKLSGHDFRSVFSGEPETRKRLSTSRTVQDLTVRMNNVIVQEDKIRFNIAFPVNGEMVELTIAGNLCAGFKAQHGFNSIIVNVPEPVGGYEILLFEIFNDTTDNEQIINSLTGGIKDTQSSFVKLYIQDVEDNVYLFETAMPECFANMLAENYPNAPKNKDMLWATNLVEHKLSQIPADEKTMKELGLDNKSRALGDTTTWTPNAINCDEFYVAGNKTICYSLPSLEYKHTNITTSTSTWVAEFYVSEHTSSAGLTSYGTNVFEYRNLKIVFMRGDNTHILRTIQSGRVYDENAWLNKLKENGEKIGVNLLKMTVSKHPAGAVIAEVVEFVNSMSAVDNNVYLGGEGYSLLSSDVTAAGEELTSCALEESSYHGGDDLIGHYFILQADVCYEYENSSVATTGGLYLEFDTYYATDFSLTPTKAYFPLEYTARNQ